VRIPQEFRIEATQVQISRNEGGDLVIHPLPIDRGTALIKALNAFDEDFVGHLEEGYLQQPAMQDRESL
jgi:antitoxin VapB